MTRTLGWLLGLKDVSSIDELHLSFGAPWAQEGPFWVFFGVVALIALAFFFYLNFQPKRSPIILATCRGLDQPGRCANQRTELMEVARAARAGLSAGGDRVTRMALGQSKDGRTVGRASTSLIRITR